ncbi:uncharacterized protein LOC113229800 [Hyposmocoma kahamanoa]|uniref:uncharacterized protein LOC113229800 n=1 Tax=Hyposmocoma kahamanoa TaxID=1477025 RepID=UPI000E6D99E3|nr:uncharacterized protein LOC113229800 [Hyposmocoma kahamanoa]
MHVIQVPKYTKYNKQNVVSVCLLPRRVSSSNKVKSKQQEYEARFVRRSIPGRIPFRQIKAEKKRAWRKTEEEMRQQLQHKELEKAELRLIDEIPSWQSAAQAGEPHTLSCIWPTYGISQDATTFITMHYATDG